ncbi:O-antigen ligase family protein [Flavobacteriaceae bacterium XHP0103]|uniref:O-antigen ligase family protein n=1 Tax=Marixanthotalea marina TaxID=2844359 RepID=UPI002989EA29|nr:O-antigen ligase family protein [Marixanthotalea marina]MBU3822722.1 O-antigen ligase family protein [Marixanthotalea marina]
MKLSSYYKLIIFHIILGVAVFLYRPLALGYFLLSTAFFVYIILKGSNKNKTFYVLMACAYVVGSEVFLRMNGGTVFYEASKYLVILFTGLGMLYRGFSNKALVYVVYILLLIPGIYVAVSTLGFESDIRRAVAFNLSGPVCLGITAIFCYKRTISFNQLKSILLAFLMPLVSMAVYLFLYTPDLQQVVTGTESNFATSGGFGPNQVATVLGIGIFVAASKFFMSKELLSHRMIDLLLLGLFGFRALVTFSRGGVITAIAMILFFLGLYYVKVNFKTKFKIKFSALAFLVVIGMVWLVSSMQTSGFLDKRYANQDAAGREKEDVTTGRVDLLAYEFGEFMENPFLGIGVGKVKEVRLDETGVAAASHNEMSRILAEHGLLGIIAFLILLLTPLVYRLGNKSNLFFYSFYIFWFLTINHSAMRIAAPAFIYGLCLLNIKYEAPAVHRQSAIGTR